MFGKAMLKKGLFGQNMFGKMFRKKAPGVVLKRGDLQWGTACLGEGGF